MKFTINLSEKEAKLVCTWIRRSIWEDYEKRIEECGYNTEENRERIYDTIGAFASIKDELTEQIMKK